MRETRIMMTRIYRRAFIGLVIFAGLSAFLPSFGGGAGAACKMWVNWRMLAGTMAGGVLALANLKGLSWGVTGLIGAEKATPKLVFFSFFRFMFLMLTLLLLLKLGLINPIGVLIGLTVVFTVLIMEGLGEANRQKDCKTGDDDGDIMSQG